jgi:chorismate-pyruvate lyase
MEIHGTYSSILHMLKDELTLRLVVLWKRFAVKVRCRRRFEMSTLQKRSLTLKNIAQVLTRPIGLNQSQARSLQE